VSSRVKVGRALATAGILATALVAAAISGCTANGPQQTAPLSGSSSSSAGGGGDSASSTGATGGGDGGTSSSGGAGSTSSKASSGAGAGSAGGGGGSIPAWPCDQDQGYWAMSTAFSAPTPELLAVALNELAYDDDAHPISFVLHAAPSGLAVGLSATTAGANGEVFAAGEMPVFAPIVPTDGEGVTTVDAQPRAFLHFVDLGGPVDLEIDHLVWSASETFSCNEVWVDVQAVLPSSTYATVLHLRDGDVTVGELVSQQMVPAPQVHLSFRGQQMSFDFSSL
jgi:hypothetical protein